MQRLRLLYISVLFVAIFFETTSPMCQKRQVESMIIGWTAVENSPNEIDSVTISANALCLRACEGHYVLDIARTERGNVSNNRQSGNFKMDAKKNAILSRTSINAPPTSGLELTLKLYISGEEVFTSTSKSK